MLMKKNRPDTYNIRVRVERTNYRAFIGSGGSRIVCQRCNNEILNDEIYRRRIKETANRKNDMTSIL